MALAAGLNPIEVAQMPLEFFVGLQNSLIKRNEQERQSMGNG